MSADELRAKAAIMETLGDEFGNDGDLESSNVCDLRRTLYECTASIIDALPDATERAELAALTGISSVPEAYQRAEGMMPHNMITGLARGAAAALLAQRQAESEASE